MESKKLRTNIIKIRVTDDELISLQKRKTQASLSRWARESLLSDSVSNKTETIVHQLPPELIRIMSGIGNNLNQIARQVNECTKLGSFGSLDATAIFGQLVLTEKSLQALREYLKK